MRLNRCSHVLGESVNVDVPLRSVRTRDMVGHDLLVLTTEHRVP
jgi:hypothetical protein